jgi:hypothetical protein
VTDDSNREADQGPNRARARARARDLDRFAELLIHQVRDQPIRICDLLAAGRMHGPDGERWRSVLAGTDARTAVTELIPDIVDQVLAHLLNALDQGDLPLAWRGADGECVDLYDLGRSEMAGWLFGEDSWRERFSGERFTR